MAACDRVHPCNSLAAPAESVFSGILFNILTALQAVQMGPASVNERPRRAQAASWTLQSQMVPVTSRATEVATLLLLPRPGHSSPHECTPLPHMQVPSALSQGMISASCQPPLLPVAVHAKTPQPRSLECVPHKMCLSRETDSIEAKATNHTDQRTPVLSLRENKRMSTSFRPQETQPRHSSRHAPDLIMRAVSTASPTQSAPPLSPQSPASSSGPRPWQSCPPAGLRHA